MKFNFRKVAAVAASALMSVSAMGFAAAANYPAPFVSGSTADVAIVYGTGSGVSSLDLIQAGNIQTDLQASLPSSATAASSSVSGGDAVLLSKSSDHLNLQNGWGVFTGTIDSGDLATVLADGTYIADDNDEFDYEQSITIGNATLTHFRDSDYEDLVDLTERTPTIGFKISSNTFILNYTIDFIEDVSSDISSARLEDIEGSDIPMMGRTYYVSEFHNGTAATATTFNQMILLDAATTADVSEGETVTVDGKSISIDYIDSDEVVFMVDGERAPASGKLMAGNSYKLSDGTYIGVRDVSKLEVSGETGSASFSLGSGKIEFPSNGGEIKLNDDAVKGVRGYMVKSSNNLDKIVIEWKTDDEVFLSPKTELVMPGFKALKYTMNDFVRNPEEKITVEKDSDTSIQMTAPLERGIVTFNLLGANSVGNFSLVGKDVDDRLLSSNASEITFYEKLNGSDYHSYFIATYNISQEGESYLLRADVSEDTTAGRNETTIESYDGTAWTTVCEDKSDGQTCDIGDVSLTLRDMQYMTGSAAGQNQSVNISAGSDVHFHYLITKGGLTVYLPFTGMDIDYGTAITSLNTIGTPGAINISQNNTVAGHSPVSFHLYMAGEDKDETLSSGLNFTLTIDETTDDNLQVSEVQEAGSGGPAGLEIGDSSTYEAYIKDDVATRILHYTNPDEDWAEVYYPTGDSESYAEVYLAEADAVLTSTPGSSGSSSLGDVLVKDSEVSSVSTKNLIVVGGSCINSAAATLVGSAACTSAFTTATGIGSGQFLIQSFGDSTLTSKIALLVAGYEAADTVNAAKFLTTQTVDTTAGKKYKGTSSTSAELVTAVV